MIKRKGEPMRVEHVIAVAVATVLFTAFGCTSSSSSAPAPAGDDDGGADAAPVDHGDVDAAGATSDAVCEYFARCVPSAIAGAYGDVATCKQRQGKNLQTAQTARGSAYTRAESDVCVAKLAALGCAAFDATIIPPECHPKGTLEKGTKCAYNAQCASGSCYHASPDSDLCGVCQDAVTEGGDCSAANCETNLACVGTICTRPRQLGEACNDVSTPCVTALTCVQGRCVAMAKANDACGAANQPICDTLVGLVCKATAPPSPNGTCIPFATSGVGGSCGIDTTKHTIAVCTKSDCSVQVTPSAGLGTCMPFLADGATCKVAAPVGCAPPASCETKKCIIARDPSLCE